MGLLIVRALLCALALCGAACGKASEARVPAPLAPGSCAASHKITFAQDQGCLNDGSVEFCWPRQGDSVDVPERLAAISPDIRCNGNAGRAGCTGSQMLCSYPTRGEVCSAMHGALHDDAWADLCVIAAFPEVSRIVPTWLE
jgi:hypothetical protein